MRTWFKFRFNVSGSRQDFEEMPYARFGGCRHNNEILKVNIITAISMELEI